MRGISGRRAGLSCTQHCPDERNLGQFWHAMFWHLHPGTDSGTEAGTGKQGNRHLHFVNVPLTGQVSLCNHQTVSFDF